MKKTVSILLALVMALSVLSVMAFAETPDVTYVVVSEEDKTCTITGAKKGIVDLIIPATIDGYKVVAIEDCAFWGNPEIETVQIPNTVEEIGQLAFSKTKMYKDETNWNNGVLYVGKFLIAAQKTVSGEYTFKSGTKIMADGAFNGCKNLTKVTIPEGLVGISFLAFGDCVKLSEVKLPSTIKSIGGYSFNDCIELKSIILPEGLEKIGLLAFNGSGITDITIPASVKVIEKYVFCHCEDLEKINVAEGSENFSSLSGVLYNKDKTVIIYAPNKIDYSDFELPETVEVIGKGAFEGASFEEFEIPAGVKTIEEGAFEGCENLKKITIPASVTQIADNAFNLIPEFEISAERGSYAYEYAKENGFLPDILIGDVNGDGVVTSIDARWALQYVALIRELDVEQVERADANGDGKITSIDARWILQIAAGTRVV